MLYIVERKKHLAISPVPVKVGIPRNALATCLWSFSFGGCPVEG